MRNLKRVLSLALAIVMVIGMMVIGAGAASFGDKKDITKNEAVDVMVGLNIMEGDDLGNFNPSDILTREQSAAMLARLVLGKDGAEAVSKNKVGVFTDVAADRWSAGYIAWAANQGFIAGNGDGTFNPTGELTGLAYAKLLLVALGFDAAVEGYVNNVNWATNIGADAVAAGLDVKGTLLADGLTRENAAQMTLQALQADVVEYESKGTEIITADGTVIRTGVMGPYAVAPDSRWSTNRKADEDYNKLDNTDDESIQLVEKLFDGVEKVKADSDEWGNPAKFAWKNGKKTMYTEWAKPVAEYYVAVSDCDLAVEIGLEKKDNADIYVDGVLADDDYVYDIYEDDYTANGTGTGVWTRIYETADKDDKNGTEYTVVAINTYFANVDRVIEEKADKNDHIKRDASVDLTVYAAADEWMDEEANVKYDLNYETDEFKKNDKVLVTILKGDDDYEQVDEDEYVVKSAELAESFQGKVSKIRKADEDRLIDNKTFTVDGETYGANVQFEVGYEAMKTKTTYELYLDAQGNLIAAETPKDTYDWAVISAMKWSTSDEDDETDGYVDATLYNMDAEKQDDVTLTAYYYDEDAKYIDFADAEDRDDAGKVIEYRGKNYMGVNATKKYNDSFYYALWNMKVEDEGEYALKELAPYFTTEDGFDGTLAADEVEDELYIDFNDNTKFLVLTQEGKSLVYTSYSFADLPEMEVDGFQYVTKGKYVQYVFVDARDAIFAGETTLVYIIDDEIDAEVEGLDSFDAWVGADSEEFELAKTNNFADAYKGSGIYELTFNADEEVRTIKKVDAGLDLVDATGSTITDLADNDYRFNASTIAVYAIVFDDDGDFEEIEESSIDEMLDYLDEATDEEILDGVLAVKVKFNKTKVETIYFVYDEAVEN